jgi:hypothetical protein
VFEAELSSGLRRVRIKILIRNLKAEERQIMIQRNSMVTREINKTNQSSYYYSSYIIIGMCLKRSSGETFVKLLPHSIPNIHIYSQMIKITDCALGG